MERTKRGDLVSVVRGCRGTGCHRFRRVLLQPPPPRLRLLVSKRPTFEVLAGISHAAKAARKLLRAPARISCDWLTFYNVAILVVLASTTTRVQQFKCKSRTSVMAYWISGLNEEFVDCNQTFFSTGAGSQPTDGSGAYESLRSDERTISQEANPGDCDGNVSAAFRSVRRCFEE